MGWRLWFPSVRADVNCADAGSALRSRQPWRLTLLAAVAVVATGCHPDQATLGLSSYGAADDPRAVEIGRAVIETGGNAVDAAVAMALTMAVTLPSRVGLGGGGLCLVHDPATKSVRTLDFLPESAPASGSAPVPGFLRGLYTLHAAYGRRHWEEALGAPESLAGLGTPVSRQLSADLRAGADRLSRDPGARRLFLSTNNRPLAEGEMLVQPELATTLGLVRQRGIAAFYGASYGATDSSLAGTLAHGLGIDGGALSSLRARWGETVQVANDNDVIHFPDRSGADLAMAWQAGLAVGEGGDWLGAMMNALRANAGSVGSAVPTAALAVVDGREQGVACVFTMGGLFGNDRVIPELGLLAGGGGGASGVGGPVLVVNPYQETTLLAASGSATGAEPSNRAAAAAVLSILHTSAIEHQPLGASSPIMAPSAALGVAEAVACLYDHQHGGKSCGAVTDARGLGRTFSVLITSGLK